MTGHNLMCVCLYRTERASTAFHFTENGLLPEDSLYSSKVDSFEKQLAETVRKYSRILDRGTSFVLKRHSKLQLKCVYFQKRLTVDFFLNSIFNTSLVLEKMFISWYCLKGYSMGGPLGFAEI